jgi:uncharacterized coiled-coil protein SlyX
MWILSWLPDNFVVFLVNAALIAGVVLTVVASFLKIIPFVNMYRLPLQIAGVVLILVGVWFHGGWAVEREWRERVRELEVKIAASEQQAAALNQQLAGEIAKKRAARRDLDAAVRKNIETKREEINAECRLNPTAVDAYNQAVKGGSR